MLISSSPAGGANDDNSTVGRWLTGHGWIPPQGPWYQQAVVLQQWTVRRGRLEQLAAVPWSVPLQVSPVTADIEDALEWFEVLPAAMGIEGLVVKGASSRYTGERSWLKVNSVGVAVFEELTRWTYDQVSSGSGGA